MAEIAAVSYTHLDVYKRQPWDTAAGVLLIQEAGGRVGTPTGADYALGPNIIVGNPKVYDELVQAIGPLTPAELRI